jgi:hypothetical protein
MASLFQFGFANFARPSARRLGVPPFVSIFLESERAGTVKYFGQRPASVELINLSSYAVVTADARSSRVDGRLRGAMSHEAKGHVEVAPMF